MAPYLLDEAQVAARTGPGLRRFLAAVAALVGAATAGYAVGDTHQPPEKKRLAGSALLSCEGLPPVVIFQLAGLDTEELVQIALSVGRAEHFITPDRPLLRGLPADRGIRPDARGRIEMVRQLDFIPPSGPAEYVVYRAGSLSEVVQRRRISRSPCTEE